MGCPPPPGVVKIYDSMVHKLPFQTKGQICALLMTKEPQIEVLHINEHQKNTNDCGLFALAFATALCLGQEPRDLSFEAAAMWEHLLKCLHGCGGHGTISMCSSFEEEEVQARLY